MDTTSFLGLCISPRSFRKVTNPSVLFPFLFTISNNILLLFSEPQQSTSSRGEMNFEQVPVVDNSFSLPRNVFERALASQTRVSITAPSSARFASPFMKDSSAHPITNGQQQRRRSSGDFVTEFTGSEAKRPRLSPPITEQDFAQRMRDKRLQREQMKLLILRRLDHTKDNILKLLKLQHMQELVHYYEKDPRSDQADMSGSFQRSEAQYHSRQGSAYESQNGTPNLACVQNDPSSDPALPKRNVSVPYTAIRGRSHISSTSHSLRRVPGINIIKDGVQSNEQRTSYSYKSSDSVGLAWDHKALPKIVAVHSVIRDESGNSTIPVSRSLLGAAAAAQMKRSYAAGNTHEESQARQNQPRSPGASKAVTDCEDDEVVLTKVIPGRARRSLSSTERKRVEANLTNPNDSAADEKERSPNSNQVKRQSFVLDHPRHAETSGLSESQAHVEHSGQYIHPGHVDHTGHVDQTSSCNSEIVEKMDLTNDNATLDNTVTSDVLATSVSQTGTVNSQSHVHPGDLQHRGRADSEEYLGGPPPYLPVLNSSEIAELEKERTSPSAESGKRRGSNPTSPRLTKTIPEISEKIMETRERIKNEAIEWKKKLLYRLEKQLLKKLRRAESATGQKTEIEDLRGKDTEKRKKSRSSSFDRRSSGEESVTDSVNDSVTDSVTDDDDDTLERSENVSQESENVEESADKLQECSQKDTEDNDPTMEGKDDCCDLSAEKCEENKQNEIPCHSMEEKAEHCENSTQVIKEEKVEKRSKELCNEFKEPLNVDEGERIVNSGENTNNVDCVTIEHCQETEFSREVEKRSVSETSGTVSANVFQCGQTEKQTNTELSESSHENSTQRFQCNDDNKECLTFTSNASEKPPLRTENLFEAFSSGFRASPSLKDDKLRLPETSEKSSVTMTQEKTSTPTETKKPDKSAETKSVKKDVKIFTNLSSLRKRLETCSKDVLKKKTENVCCDRNIWTVLRRDGIF